MSMVYFDDDKKRFVVGDENWDEQGVVVNESLELYEEEWLW